MKIRKRTISLMTVLGLALAGPLALTGCEENNDFGDDVENAGEEFGEQVDETTEEFGDEVDDAT